MSTWQEQKRQARRAFLLHRYGIKQRACCACNGSGIYDNHGSPACGGCDGTGKEPYRGPKSNAVINLLMSLNEVMQEDAVYDWLSKKNKAFDNLNPIQVIERGEIEKLEQMAYLLISGVPG